MNAWSRIFKSVTNFGSRGKEIQVPRPPAVFWVPAVIVGVLVILPLVYLILRAMGAGGEIWNLLFRTRTMEIIGRTIILVIAVTGTSVIVSIPLAWLTTRTDLPFRKLWSVLTILPLVIPSYVAGFIMIATLGPRGILQQLLEKPFGIERLPEIYGFPGAMLTIVFIGYPFVLLPIKAAMRGLDSSLEEASRSLGHNSWSTFYRVVLPQLRPSIAAGALIVALYTLKDFGAVSLLRYETFTWAIYLQYQTSFDRASGAALSLILVVMAVVIIFFEFRTRGRLQYHRATLGVSRPPVRYQLGLWRWPALGFCALVVLFTVAMPIFVLGYWLIRGILAGETLPAVWSLVLNSGYASILATLIIVIAALPVAILAVRYPGRMSVLLERSTYIGFALPGIVIALALVFFGANYATPIYQTLGLLIFAYLILFLPQAIGAIRTSLLQVSPRIEEAARSLGRKPFQVFTTVTFPLVRSGILAGAALVFLTVMKELPATLILSPIGFRTLATAVWSATSEAFFARAALPALLLILLSSVTIVFLVIREGRESI